MCNEAFEGESLADRIKRKRSEKRMSQGKLAKEIGISYAAIQTYEQGKFPGAKNLLEIARKLGCSMDWLMTGEDLGELKQENPFSMEIGGIGMLVNQGIAKKDPKKGLPKTLSTKVVVGLPGVSPQLGKKGELIVNKGNALGQFFFRKDWLKRLGDPDKFLLMKVEGDAMEPTLEKGSFVIIDVSRKTVTQPSIYAIREKQNILIRRIHQQIGGHLKLICDNTKLYPVQEWDPTKKSLPIIGRVIWSSKVVIS